MLYYNIREALVRSQGKSMMQKTAFSLASLISLSTQLMQLGPPSLKTPLSTVEGLVHQTLIEILSSRHDQSDQGNSSVEISSSQISLGIYQIELKVVKWMSCLFLKNRQHPSQKVNEGFICLFYSWCPDNEHHIPILISFATSRNFTHNNFVSLWVDTVFIFLSIKIGNWSITMSNFWNF